MEEVRKIQQITAQEIQVYEGGGDSKLLDESCRNLVAMRHCM